MKKLFSGFGRNKQKNKIPRVRLIKILHIRIKNKQISNYFTHLQKE